MSLLLALAIQAAPAPPVQPIRASKIVLVGDSTMQTNSGWGGAFCAYHVTSFATCVDLGRGGRSSGSYRAEGSWDIALAEAKVPGYVRTWVLIQLGHNDQPGKPGRSTDLVTEFPANIARYVADVRAAGAIPVLFTPLTRRTFKGGKLDRDLDPWAAAIRKVAAETKTPLYDLNAESAAAVEAMGETAADRFAQAPQGSAQAPAAPAATEVEVKPLAEPKRAFDRTHLGVEGANYFAAMVTLGLAKTVPEMRPLLLR